MQREPRDSKTLSIGEFAAATQLTHSLWPQTKDVASVTSDHVVAGSTDQSRAARRNTAKSQVQIGLSG